MQHLEVSGVVRLICRSLDVKGLNWCCAWFCSGFLCKFRQKMPQPLLSNSGVHRCITCPAQTGGTCTINCRISDAGVTASSASFWCHVKLGVVSVAYSRRPLNCRSVKPLPDKLIVASTPPAPPGPSCLYGIWKFIIVFPRPSNTVVLSSGTKRKPQC